MIRRFLPLILLLAGWLVAGAQPQRMAVDHWHYRYRGSWHPATVPGCIHTDLLAGGFIPDPFWGTNEDRVQWVSDSMWTYSPISQRIEFKRNKSK